MGRVLLSQHYPSQIRYEVNRTLNLKELRIINENASSPHLPPSSLSVSFSSMITLTSSSSLQCWHSPHSLTHKRSRLYDITEFNDKEREGGLPCPEKKYYKEMYQTRSLSHSQLLFLPLFFTFSLTDFSCIHTCTFGHTPFSRRDVNVSTSFFLTALNRSHSSLVIASLTFEAIARTKAQASCVAALCGWGRKFSLKRNFWEWKIQWK